MMEKLLHERLRELENWCQLYERYNIREVSFTKLMKSFADEIERCYIPRPRFEDGEPVQFGKKVEGCDGNVKALLIFNDGSGLAYGAKDDPWEPSDGAPFGGDDIVKRPTPKVYDADGVEIKVGDTVYSVYNGNPMTVEQVRQSDKQLYGKDSVCCGGGIFFPATDFTHERPVFDAEGVRICKGDTVWHVRTGQKATVTTVYRDDQTLVEVEIVGHLMDYEPSDLTHREPDSLEKLRDDVRGFLECSIEDDVKSSAYMVKIEDRLTALIERGA